MTAPTRFPPEYADARRNVRVALVHMRRPEHVDTDRLEAIVADAITSFHATHRLVNGQRSELLLAWTLAFRALAGQLDRAETSEQVAA